MSQPATDFKIPLLPTSAIFERLLKVVEESFHDVREPSLVTSITSESLIEPVNTGVKEFIAHVSIAQCRKDFSAYPMLRITRFTVRMSDEHGKVHQLDYQEHKGNLFGTLEYKSGAVRSTLGRAYKVLEAINTHIKPIAAESLHGVVATELEKSSIGHHEATLTALESSTIRVVQATADQQKQITGYLIDAQKKIDDQLEERKNKLQSEFDAKKSQLDKDIEEFEKRKKDLNDKDRTVVQRDILKELKKIINEQEVAKLSNDTKDKRNVVQNLLWILCAVGCFLIVFSGVSLIRWGPTHWHFFVSLASGSIMLVSTLLYHINWSNHWSNEHARAEFMTRKMKSDTLRAGWIAELCLEWQKEGGNSKEFPPALLAALSQNLFGDPQSAPTPKHPIEHLLATFYDAKELKVGKEGIEVKKQ